MSKEQGAAGRGANPRDIGQCNERDKLAPAAESSNQPVFSFSRRGAPSALCAITGWGAVSPAGWDARSLREAVAAGTVLPVKTERRSEGAPARRFRLVPAQGTPPGWMRQPRFRRTTAIARYAVHAAVEALGETKFARAQSGALRVGVVFCTMNGCVQFSRRFFQEALDHPALASPILFPETVYNAPASHLAALLGSPEINYTLVGDSAQFLSGMALAAQWLADELTEACLVVAAEESDWLTEEALLLFGKDTIAAEGAAAVLLEPCTQATAATPILQHVTEAWTYGRRMTRRQAAWKVRHALDHVATADAVLCDGLGFGGSADAPERAAWQSWPGTRVSVRGTVGEGFSVTSGWQTVVALEWLREGGARQALVSAVGLTQQAAGAVLGVGMSPGEVGE